MDAAKSLFASLKMDFFLEKEKNLSGCFLNYYFVFLVFNNAFYAIKINFKMGVVRAKKLRIIPIKTWHDTAK
jgi:hypothetical protein